MSLVGVAPVVAVTVLEDRASVTRRAALSIEAGQQRITIERVSVVLADKTLFATATGARVLDVRIERYLAPVRPNATSDQPLAVLRDQHAELIARRDAATARYHAAQTEVAAIAEILEAALGDLAIAAARGVAAEGVAAQLAELDRAEAVARETSVAAELEVEETRRLLDRLAARIRLAEVETHEHAARLIVDVVADAPADVVLTLGYVVPGAAWRPYHRAVLDVATKQVEWQTTACVWQATGEDWVDAALTFSLERPSLGVEPPDLGDDELRTRKRADQVVVEAREQVHHTTGLGASGPAQVPGIDDGGLGLVLSAPKATIRADGMPHRVPVGGFSTAAQPSLVAIPLRSPWVHLRARLVNTGAVPLLAGPVDLVMASGYVGRAEIGFVAAGEKFHLGFGPESDVRIHREETRERDEGLLGGQTQTIRVAVRLSNLGGDRRTIDLTERIPISEVEQVQIEAAAPDAYLLDDEPGGEEITQVTARALDERGMVTWAVELPPFGRRAVTLQYKIKSARGVAGV